MNRTSAVIVAALLAIAAVEFGLLGASAAGLTGSDQRRAIRHLRRRTGDRA
jgi:hypothetical protein